MKSGWTEEVERFVARATRGLAPDAELRMEVSHELRTHLEETALYARATGATAEEAEAHALKAFGDPDEVSAELRAANFRRMRARSALKWAARLTLVPAAAAVMIALLLQSGESVSGLGSLEHASAVERWLAGRAERHSLRANMTEEERFFLRAGPEQIAARYPNNPVYHAACVMRRLGASGQWPIGEQLSLLERGEKLEPENAFYNYMAAATLLEAGGEITEDTTRIYTVVTRGKNLKRHAHSLRVRDRDLVERGLRELRKGNAKPRYNSHAMDCVLARWKLLREPLTLREAVTSMSRLAQTPLSDVPYMGRLVRGATAYAGVLAEEGRFDAAREVLNEARMAPLKVGASSSLPVELSAARKVRAEFLSEAAFIHEALGDAEAARACRAEAGEAQTHFVNWPRYGPSDFSQRERERTEALFFNMTSIPQVRGNWEVSDAWLLSERIVLERVALAVILLIGFAGLGYLGLRISPALAVRGAYADGARLLFIGWRPLAWMLGWSVCAPLAAYYVWTRLMPFGCAQFGTRYCLDRFALEITLFGIALLGVPLVMGYRAVRKRCAAAGMRIPPPGMFRAGPAWRIAAGAAGLAVLVYAFIWELPGCRGRAGYFVAAVSASMAVLWLMAACRRFALLPRAQMGFRLTFARSFAPLLATAIVLAGVIGQVYLYSAERHYVSAIQGPSWWLFADEVEMAGYREARERFIEWHGARMAEREEGESGKAPRDLTCGAAELRSDAVN